MTRMTGPDCAVMCNYFINIHTYIQRVRGRTAVFFLFSAAATVRLGLHAVFFICTFRAIIVVCLLY